MARAGSGEGEIGRGQWGGEQGNREEEMGRGATGRGRRGGRDGEGGNEEGEMLRGQKGGGDGEGDDGEGVTGRGRWGRGNGEGEMGKEQHGGKGKRGCKHIECLDGMRLQFFLTLFTRATPGTPASLY